MSIESRLYNVEQTLANLQESFIQSQRNQTPIVNRTDESYNKIPQIDGNTENIEVTSANLDYVAMMVDVDIPTED